MEEGLEPLRSRDNRT
ncbi:hypothetical protein EYF80_066674 [Liparis tanakae]|uniref:Uncharacterized protein n=1 Tax=Liparis tanakae TaxID=230148 RepID=A0A4Z2E374_9TELE|nr:hypothetical protein EYF80_066674 [Liparis tanakae]